MAKISKLTRSQNAHFRLRQKAADMPGKKGDVIYYYHTKVIDSQHDNKRILSKKERRGIFASIRRKVFGR